MRQKKLNKAKRFHVLKLMVLFCGLKVSPVEESLEINK
jgi:hypothetical protein